MNWGQVLHVSGSPSANMQDLTPIHPKFTANSPAQGGFNQRYCQAALFLQRALVQFVQYLH